MRASLNVVRSARMAIWSLVMTHLLVSAVFLATPAQASAPATCRGSQVVVSAGATLTDTTYPVVTSSGVHQMPAAHVIPLYFLNRGATCRLLMGAPAILVVRDTTNVSSLATLRGHDVSTPTVAESPQRQILFHHQRLVALFVVTRPVGSHFTGCEPATASGIVIQGYAGPIGTFHFVKRSLPDVCFDTGGATPVLNFGVSWATQWTMRS
jgi:hypothetical protein